MIDTLTLRTTSASAEPIDDILPRDTEINDPIQAQLFLGQNTVQLFSLSDRPWKSVQNKTVPAQWLSQFIPYHADHHTVGYELDGSGDMAHVYERLSTLLIGLGAK